MKCCICIYQQLAFRKQLLTLVKNFKYLGINPSKIYMVKTAEHFL